MITKKLFLEILEVLDGKLQENKLELAINIYGGVAMMLCYDVRPATKDVDAMFHTSPQIECILNEIAEMYNLPSDWINREINEPLKYLKREDLKQIFKFKSLKVFAPSAEQMLAMKILSARAEPHTDFADAEYLIKYLKLEKLEDILKIFDKYVGLKYLKDRQKIFLNYIGKDLGKPWKEFII